MTNEDDAKTPTITPAGAIELEETQLDKVKGGASDYLLEIDGIKGESRDRSRHSGGVNVALADGSVR